MKAILIILAIALSSCSTDDSQERTEPANCFCETVLTATVFTLPNQTPQTVVTVENDCSGAQRQRTLVGVYTVGQKICD